jgi:hypothetical protein
LRQGFCKLNQTGVKQFHGATDGSESAYSGYLNDNQAYELENVQKESSCCRNAQERQRFKLSMNAVFLK